MWFAQVQLRLPRCAPHPKLRIIGRGKSDRQRGGLAVEHHVYARSPANHWSARVAPVGRGDQSTFFQRIGRTANPAEAVSHLFGLEWLRTAD